MERTGDGRGAGVHDRVRARGPARLAVRGAARGLRAAVAWGSTAEAGERTGPVDVAGSLLAPVLGLYGAQDAANPPSALMELERKGRRSGRAVEIVTYAGPAADFWLPGEAGYDEAAALDEWGRMIGWFHRFAASAPR